MRRLVSSRDAEAARPCLQPTRSALDFGSGPVSAGVLARAGVPVIPPLSALSYARGHPPDDSRHTTHDKRDPRTDRKSMHDAQLLPPTALRGLATSIGACGLNTQPQARAHVGTTATKMHNKVPKRPYEMTNDRFFEHRGT